MKWVTFVLTFALLCCQYSLWFGKGSVGHTEELQEQLVRQEEKNQTLTLRNNFLNAEVEDLAHGQEAIAEIARVELGYVQDGEVYYRIIDRRIFFRRPFSSQSLYNHISQNQITLIMYDVNTHDVRRFFAHVWQHRLAPLQLDGLQQKALRIIEAHPEYGHYLEDIEQYLDKEWLPEDGESNPFLHMSLHLSLQEQSAIDQPPGIRAIHHQLCARYNGDWVKAEHDMMEALAETIWEAQRYGRGLDVNAYMTRLRKLVGLGQEEKARLNPHEVGLMDTK